MADEEYVEMKMPLMRASLIGNCILLQCESDDEAIFLLEIFKEMNGNKVTIEPKEE